MTYGLRTKCKTCWQKTIKNTFFSSSEPFPNFKCQITKWWKVITNAWVHLYKLAYLEYLWYLVKGDISGHHWGTVGVWIQWPVSEQQMQTYFPQIQQIQLSKCKPIFYTNSTEQMQAHHELSHNFETVQCSVVSCQKYEVFCSLFWITPFFHSSIQFFLSSELRDCYSAKYICILNYIFLFADVFSLKTEFGSYISLHNAQRQSLLQCLWFIFQTLCLFLHLYLYSRWCLVSLPVCFKLEDNGEPSVQLFVICPY